MSNTVFLFNLYCFSIWLCINYRFMMSNFSEIVSMSLSHIIGTINNKFWQIVSLLSQYQQIRQIHNHTMKYSPSLPMSHCRSLLHQAQKHLQALDLPSIRMFSAQIQLLVAWWHRRCSGITNCFNMSTKKRLVSGGGMFKMAQNFSIAAFPLPIE